MGSKYKFAVIGAGPIGSILGAHLLKNGEDVTLVDVARERLLKMQKEGIRIKDPNRVITGDIQIKPPKVCFSGAEIKEIDVVFIAVKTYALPAVISDLRKADIPAETKIISFQNGIDTEKELAEEFGSERVFRVIINYAGGLKYDGEVHITFFNKPNYIGVVDERATHEAEKLSKILTDAGLDTKFTPEINKYIWEKAILNSALSPVCALTGLTMKSAMENAMLFEVVKSIIKEGIEVAKTQEIEFPENFFDTCINYLSKGGYHKPSMLVDVEQGKPTEINYLNGKIVEYAKTSVPYNWTITSLIKGIEGRVKK